MIFCWDGTKVALCEFATGNAAISSIASEYAKHTRKGPPAAAQHVLALATGGIIMSGSEEQRFPTLQVEM
eukprot:4225899-Amphidinium_carterae.1